MDEATPVSPELAAASLRALFAPPPSPAPEDPAALRRAAIIAKAGDFDAVRRAVDDAGGFVRSLWVTFVTLGAYLVVAAGSVTHRQLFLVTPIKLPLLDVQLPLVAFFVIAPGFFLIFHFYLLLQLQLLAGKLERYNVLLTGAGVDEATRRDLRQQLPNDLLVQFLSGPRDSREGAVGRMLYVVAWLTMVAGPLVLLLLIQYKFLPYQEEMVTWVHRGAVLLDVAMLWWFWPRVVAEWRRGRRRGLAVAPAGAAPPGRWPASRVAYVVRALAGGIGVLAVSTCVLTFPGESIDAVSPARDFHRVFVWCLPPIERDSVKDDSGCPAPERLRAYWWRWQPDNFKEEGWITRVPAARRLVTGALRLREESFVDDEKVAKLEKRDGELKLKPWEGERTLRIAGRKFHAAFFFHADLRRADLRGAEFTDGFLNNIKLGGARLDGAGFQNASLALAELQSASLDRARLQGASLDRARLQGASLALAELQGASLNRAQLQGASLDGARLQGASLDGAALQGASLNRAELQGASLNRAQLQGAWLDGARLQGASLDGAALQGASLDGAALQGASLDGAELQGVSLNGANLQGAYLVRSFLRRASGGSIDLEGARIARNRLGANSVIFRPRVGDLPGDAKLTTWINTATQFVNNDNRKQSIIQHLQRLKRDAPTRRQDFENARQWRASEQASADLVTYRARLANEIDALICAAKATGAPHVARGLMQNGRLAATGEHLDRLRNNMTSARTDPAKCPGVAGFTENDWAALAKLPPRPEE